MREITGVPIKFAGVSENSTDWRPSRQEQMAGRILGMGDVVSLVEATAKAVDMEAAQKLAAKVKAARVSTSRTSSSRLVR